MSKDISSFDILKIMGQRDLDVRGFNLYSNIVQIQMVGKGKNEYGKLTLTIDPKTTQQLLNDSLSNENSFVGMLIVADRRQFEDIRKELSEQ